MKKYFLTSHRLFFTILIVLSGASCATDSNSGSTGQPPAEVNSTPADVPEKAAAKTDTKTIIFFGNSLSAGYGLDPAQGFVGLIEKRIDSLNLNYKVINAGNSGETTSGGKERVAWILENYQPDIFVLELGGNDALRGLPVTDAEANLQSIIDAVKNKYPTAKILLAGMMAPPNMGNEYTTKFAAMYPRLAKKNKAALIPFLLDKVGGQPGLNLPDGIHPNVEGHQIVTETIWKELEGLLVE